MLFWRITLGTLFSIALIVLCWFDYLAAEAAYPGLVLFPILIVITLLAGSEYLDLAASGRLHPLPWTVHVGNLLLIASNWVPPLILRWTGHGDWVRTPYAWPILALAIGVVLAFAGEMYRYTKPGGVTANTAVAVMALVYIGFLLSFVVDLRMRWGVMALASLLIVVKAGDIGAYTVGRLIGRNKLAPALSPGKTVEGAVGALVFASLGAWLAFGALLPWMAEKPHAMAPWWGWLTFGLLVGGTGMMGDLAESLMKRDVGQKDSSAWLPGLGGVLDIFDSILLAAPAAWFCWSVGVVGR